MILSVSRRTDIPSYYSEWFINRLKEGFLYVRNPMNYNQISKISLKLEDIECIVFWTKNPKPMLKYLDYLEKYNYYFQFSLTSYNNKIEKNLPPKRSLVPIFKELSQKIGKERVIWRYDPILISSEVDVKYHIKNFRLLAEKLKGYTEKCVISFLDEYPKIENRLKENGIRAPKLNEIHEISMAISEIAKECNLKIETCSEKIDLSIYNIEKGKCIDDSLIRKITGLYGKVKKDKNQREECGCVKSIDIGAYNTCLNECVYCYANYNKKIKFLNDKHSPLLVGKLGENEKVTERVVEKLFSNQMNFKNIL
jgi:DNA repair photolyase